MRLGKVIGRVTLNKVVPELTGARWLVVSPFNRHQFQQDRAAKFDLTTEPSLVVWDNLGGGLGDTIGFVEGREAAQPLDPVAAIDAINAALVDSIFYQPMS